MVTATVVLPVTVMKSRCDSGNDDSGGDSDDVIVV